MATAFAGMRHANDADAIENETIGPEIVHVVPKGATESPPSTADGDRHGVPELVGGLSVEEENEKRRGGFLANLRRKRRGWGQYILTREFWMVLVLGQILSLCLTSTSTFSYLLSQDGISIPAFQNLFNYCLLSLIFTPITIYRYGLKKWLRLIWKDGWKYFLLGFVDVEGNYFFVLAYKYASILSITLIDFWAIVVVMIISLIFLKVRYHITQYVGVLICLGGLGILLGSDHITGYNQFPASNALKGDLFALLGATFYGISNTYQEFMVSKRPVYEVLGQLSFWGVFILAVQAAIFDRESIQHAVWSSNIAGYFTGYTLILALFYNLTPLMFRLSSAAFFNISLLTTDFWSVIIGIEKFHLHVHWMYPIAFVCIVMGMLVYFITEGVMGDSEKPWLGEDQERGVDGVGTAKRKIERRNRATGTEV